MNNDEKTVNKNVKDGKTQKIIPVKIGEKIRKIREWRDFSQEAVAAKLAMTTTGYGKIERNESDVTITKLYLIAQVLNVSVQDILGLEKDSILVKSITKSRNNIVSQGNIYTNEGFEKERNLYEAQIENLKLEVLRMEGIIDKLISKG